MASTMPINSVKFDVSAVVKFMRELSPKNAALHRRSCETFISGILALGRSSPLVPQKSRTKSSKTLTR